MAKKRQKYVVKGKQSVGSITITFWAESDEEAWKTVTDEMKVTDAELYRKIDKVNNNPRIRAGKGS